MLREFQKEIEALKRKLTEGDLFTILLALSITTLSAASGSEGESSEDNEESVEFAEKKRQRRKSEHE